MSAHYRNVKRRGCFFFLACWIERRELVIIDVRSHVIGVGSWHKRTPGLVCGEHKNAVLVRPIEFCLVTCLYDVDINPPPHHFFKDCVVPVTTVVRLFLAIFYFMNLASVTDCIFWLLRLFSSYNYSFVTFS